MKPNLFNKVFTALVFFMVLFYSFWLGVDLQRGDTKEVAVDLVLLAFWLFGLFFFLAMSQHSEKLDRELEESKKNLDNAMKDLLGEILGDSHAGHEHKIVKAGTPENQLHESLTDVLVDIIAEVTKDRTPEPKHFPEIKKRFEAKTGHEVIIKKEGLGLNVKIGKKPMSAKKSTTKKAPVKKSASKAPAKKTVTKKKGTK